MYEIAVKAKNDGNRPSFKGLIEIMTSEVVILTAIHNVKANKGSYTPGCDGEVIDSDILEKDYETIISKIRSNFNHYEPSMVRRVWIPKQGKKELRPLGIATITERIIQECIRIVIDPMFEPQFYRYSFGFRPMRDAGMAIETITNQVHLTRYYWFVEGDIKKYFDSVNHRILLKRLWHMGIRDKRVLMIIKLMLKTGIIGEIKVNLLGVHQGYILAPLLSNVYLDIFDQWVARQWEDKNTKFPYKDKYYKIKVFKEKTKLQPAYSIRYCDDWVIITNTKENAENWKDRIAKFLKQRLKLSLSEEKTFVTNVKKKPIKFVGFEYKVVKGKSRSGFVTRTIPNRIRLPTKVNELHKKIKLLRYENSKRKLVHKINLVNSIIRGIINYYSSSTWVNVMLGKYADALNYAGYKSLKRFGGKWIVTSSVNNLRSVHENYKMKIPAIEYENSIIGITSLYFCKWEKQSLKNPEETPYSPLGRSLYTRRTYKKPIMVRADSIMSLELSELISKCKTELKYNFEYLLNRAYAFNRDKGKCRVCGKDILVDVHIHHIRPYLELCKTNKIINLASTHKRCHQMIHDSKQYTNLNKKAQRKLIGFREKLVLN